MARRMMTPKQKRQYAVRATAAVLALQAALVLTFLVTPGEPPRSGTLWQLLWAASRKPQFYPLVLVLMVTPPLTLLAWRVRGHHHRWLAAGWCVFLGVALGLFGHRIWTMLRILWWQYGA